jgi:hypothetical protein
MTRSASLLLLALAILLASPTVSAHHWEDNHPGDPGVGGSPCTPRSTMTCQVEHFCTGGSPPQVVDTALHCAQRAPVKVQGTMLWAPYFAWVTADQWSTIAEDNLHVANDTVSPGRQFAERTLCDQVWSAFCGDPVGTALCEDVWSQLCGMDEVPEHAPFGDPFGYYPVDHSPPFDPFPFVGDVIEALAPLVDTNA